MCAQPYLLQVTRPDDVRPTLPTECDQATWCVPLPTTGGQILTYRHPQMITFGYGSVAVGVAVPITTAELGHVLKALQYFTLDGNL